MTHWRKGIWKKYIEEIQKHKGYMPTWLPMKKVSVGDYGIFTDDGYQRKGNLSQIGIQFKTTSPQSKGDVDYSSSRFISTVTKLAGKPPPTGVSIPINKAGVSVKLRRTDAIRFRAIGCESIEIDNLADVENEILARHKLGKWPINRVVIVEVIKAKGTTVIISNGRKAQVDLSTKVNVTHGQIDLADVNMKFDVITESEIGEKVIAKGRLTPLFKSAAILDKRDHLSQLHRKAAQMRQKDSFKLRKIETLMSLNSVLSKNPK